MALNKANLVIAAVAPATVAASAPKIAPHLMTSEQILENLRIYGVAKKEGQFKICLGNVTVPFPVIHNEADDSWNYVGEIPGFDASSDEDKEVVREHYVAVLSRDAAAMAHGMEALQVRAARLAAAKAEKAAKELGTKAFKAGLAVQATTAVAASTLANEAA